MLNKFRHIFLLFALFYAIGSTAAAEEINKNVKLNLTFTNTEIKEVLKEIKAQTQYDFVYNANIIDDQQKISVDLKNADLETVLKACFHPLKIDYVIQNNIIVLQKQKDKPAEAQNSKIIKGKVLDSQNIGLPGATILLPGTGLGIATDMDGNFIMSIPNKKEQVLNISFVGMETVNYSIKENEEFITIRMVETIESLNEVVVTGMEVIKKEHMTGSASVITAKDIAMQGITSIDRILEGMVAGLNSTTTSGAPGTRAQITIRGENNLSGTSEPLWIVDGLPLTTGVPVNTSGDYAGTVMQDGVGNIMPEDIESISILKDASAAAIYGARAANGVIVITTKKGFRSKTQINYSGNYDIGIAPRSNIDFMNSAEKLRYEKAIIDLFGLNYSTATGRGGHLYRRRLEGYMTESEYQNEVQRMQNTNTDWFDVLFRTAHSHSHNISIRGGNEELTYYTSANFTQKNGLLFPNKYEQAGIRIKLDYRPIEKLIFDLSVNASTRKNRNHASAIDPFKYAVFANPYERPYDQNGNYAADLSYLANNYNQETASGYTYSNFNIVKELNETKEIQNGMDTEITFNVRYDVIPGLTLQSIIRKSMSYNTQSTEVYAGTYTSWINETFARAVFKNALLPSQYDNGELSESSGKNHSWSLRNQIDYSFDIKKDHLFSFMIANEVMSKKFNNFGYKSPIYYQDFRITGLPTFDQVVDYANLIPAIRGMYHTAEGQDRSVSFLGLVRYSYKDRYVANFNYRADGADVIGDNNRFQPLWAAGARYNIHKESFFPENKFVNELALRFSYGYTANIDRSAYPFSTISFGSNSYMGNLFVSEFEYPNPTVKWEKKRDRNIGVDVSFLNSRLNLTADFYNNRTTDVLEQLNVAPSTGRTTVKANGGIIENSGIELRLSAKIIETNNFSFRASANVARNKNVIKKSYYSFSNYKEAIATDVTKGGELNIIGQETGALYGWKTAGVNPETGNPRYYLTEDGKRAYAAFIDGWSSYTEEQKAIYSQYVTSFNSIPDYVDMPKWRDEMMPYMMPSMQYLGRRNPKYVGGFNTSIRYKGLEFTTSWTFKAGHIIPKFNDLQNAPNNSASAAGGYSGDLAVSATNREKKYLYFWQAPGDRTNVSKFETFRDHWATYYTSEKYTKGDYLRMTNLALNYRISSYALEKYGIKNLSVGFNARNLLTFTKYKGLDVGSNGAFTYPVAKEFNFKVSIGF